MRRNDWQKRFGAKRRAIDRAILAAAEQQIANQERARAAGLQAIANAFGSSIQ